MAEPKKKFSLWTAPAKLNRSYKLSLFFILLLGYLAFAPWLLSQYGNFSRIFVFIFTLPAAFFWGLRGGFLVSLVTPVLVLTDMAMPEMAGDRLARELLSIRPAMPIILCTGHSDRIDRERAAELGIVGYCLKPMAAKILATEVRNVLDQTPFEKSKTS